MVNYHCYLSQNCYESYQQVLVDYLQFFLIFSTIDVIGIYHCSLQEVRLFQVLYLVEDLVVASQEKGLLWVDL
jgi:hypothetical protein